MSAASLLDLVGHSEFRGPETMAKCLALTALISMVPLATAFRAPSACLPSVSPNFAAATNIGGHRPAPLRVARMQVPRPKPVRVQAAPLPAACVRRAPPELAPALRHGRAYRGNAVSGMY